MDTISVSTNFEYYPPSTSDLCENFTTRRKIDGKKELRKKLKVAETRNEILESTTAANAIEISELKIHVQNLNDVLKNSDKLNNASSKIIELSKRNRQLKAESELYKSKYNKLEAKFDKLEKDKTADELSSLDTKSKKTSCCHIMTSIEQLESELNSTKQKLFEALNMNTELRNNLKLAQKCLQQEIGENFNLNLLSSSNSNWRGRAQQIISLQNKISELKQRVEGASLLTDDSSRAQIRKLEANRKYLQDDLQNQIKSLSATIDEQNTKISALKARNKNLVDEAMNYKLKTLNLMEQSGINDNSIAAMNEKLNIQKYHYEYHIKELERKIDDFDEIRNELEAEHDRTRAKLEKLENLVGNKQQTIEQLSETNKRLQQELKSICGDFLFSCKDLKKSEFLAILDSLESEKVGLAKLNNTLNERLEVETDKNKIYFETISKQKIKISRLEAKIKEHQKYQEQAVEKKKRNQRMSEYSNNLSSRLSVSAMVFENSNLSFDPHASGGSSECSQDIVENMNLENLKNKIEFLTEKVDFLNEKLKITKNERENDTKIFNEIMSNSKTILLNMLQDVKTNNKSECQSDFGNITDRCHTNRTLDTTDLRPETELMSVNSTIFEKFE